MPTIQKFCPTCDALVAVSHADEQRCPACHKALAAQPDAAALAAAPQGRRIAPVLLGAGVLLGAAVGVWWVQGRSAKPAADQAQDAAATPVWRFASLGLSAGRANPPAVADAAMQQWARGHADAKALVAALQGLGKAGGLQAIGPAQRRRHEVEDTAALWQQVQQGKAKPAHSLEIALLAKALVEARGDKAELLAETAGVQTPLLLSRSRYAIRVGAVTYPAALEKPRTVSSNEAAATWLVLRANGNRLAGRFKLVAEDLVAAEALDPKLEAVRFVRGVSQLDQQLAEQGIATCDAALAKADDPLARLYLAEVALTMDQPVKALQRCEDALKAWPGLPEVLVTKAMILLQRLPSLPADQKTKSLEEIEGWVQTALKAKEPPAGARVAQAQVLLAREQRDAAEALLGAAVREHKDIESTLLLSQLLEAKGKPEEAAQLFASAGAPLDDERVAISWVQALLKAKQPDKAMEIAEKAYALAPESGNIGLLRADLLRQNGKVAEAIAALEPLKGGADGERIVLLQAQLHLQSGDAAKAVSLVAPQFAKKPDSRETAVLYLMSLALGGKGDEAAKVADQVLARQLLKPIEVVELWIQSGQLPRAQQLLEAEVAKGKPDPQAAATLIAIYTAQGHKEKATALRDQVVKQAGDKGKELGQFLDQAMASAEAEAKAMHQHGGDTPQPPPKAP